ncbi:chitinase CLP-like [Rutidosis leptorrhynchoides]|uniref:chitinase CLP-like n=1 Tax=Rutidosis leptorrhynchoides TaxID=125765 RepID=UPI003A99EC43
MGEQEFDRDEQIIGSENIEAKLNVCTKPTKHVSTTKMGELIVATKINDRHNVLSQYTHFNTSVIPIIKDTKTSLHKIPWFFHEQQSNEEEAYYLIDLEAPFTWKDCVVRRYEVACGLEEGCRFPLRCDHTLCKEARKYVNNPTCPSLNITSKYGCNICAVTPLNPISKSCKLSQLTTDLVTIYVTNGRNPSWFLASSFGAFGAPFVLSCAPPSLLRSFPKSVHAVASFSWSKLSFPRQAYHTNQADKFALCLPSATSTPGVTFLGDGPFYFTSFPNLDLRKFLSYTPMVRKTSKSLGYFIKINRILFVRKKVPLPLSIGSQVRLSTIKPYTALRSDIYKALIVTVSEATKTIPQVDAVKPFGLCYIASGPTTRVSYRFPDINLEMEGGAIWTLSEENLLTKVGDRVACLALVDGGSGTKNAIVIGTYQMENNFLFFDLEKQRLGFSSSLLARGTSCNKFNFTLV